MMLAALALPPFAHGLHPLFQPRTPSSPVALTLTQPHLPEGGERHAVPAALSLLPEQPLPPLALPLVHTYQREASCTWYLLHWRCAC